MEYKYVKFRPWVGKDYNPESRGKKLLILGDSHYCEKECASGGRCCPKCEYSQMINGTCDMMTRDLMKDEYLQYRENSTSSTRYFQTILSFEKNIFNRIPSPEESITFWNSVIFYNYKQHSQLAPQKDRPTTIKEIQDYREAFMEVLEYYKPTHIIVWSKFLFTKDWLPDGAQDIADYTLKATENGTTYDAPIRTFKLKDGTTIHAIITQHPCCKWGKDQAKWHTLLRAFLN